MGSILDAIGSPIINYQVAVLMQNFEGTLWTLSASRYVSKRLAVMMKIFGEFSGRCRLADIYITAHRYRALSEQFIFFSFISFCSLSLSLSLKPATEFLSFSQIHHFSCVFSPNWTFQNSFRCVLNKFNRSKSIFLNF